MSQQPYGFWFLAFISVASIYLLLSEYRQSRESLLLNTWIAAWIVYAVFVCDWISYFGYIAIIAFALCQGLFAYASAFIVKKIPKFNPLYFALIFVAYEWILSHLPVLAFSWLNLSTIGIDIPLINQYARFGGGAALTFIVAVTSASAVEYLPNIKSIRYTIDYKNAAYVLGAIFLAFLIAMVPFGNTKPISIAVVQGNDKNRELTNDEIKNEYLTNTHMDLANKIYEKYDVIVFPESSLDSSPEDDMALNVRLSLIAEKTHKLLLVNAIEKTSKGDVNRNFFYDPKMKLLGTYDKRRLVPFGEYLPAKSLIGWLPIFEPIGEGFVPGTKDKTVDGVTSLICYESAFSSDVRRAISQSTKLLVVTTNNRSYRRSGNSEQHIAQSRLRALEFGISVVHASVSGSSALIDNRGLVVDKTGMFKRSVLKGEIPYGTPDSFYAKTFDWLSYLAIIVVGYQCFLLSRVSKWRNQIQRR